MKVLKFGGTSMGSVEIIQTVKQILETESESVIVVVSAFSGVTNQLLDISQKASTSNADYKIEFQKLVKRHLDAVNQLVDTSKNEIVLKEINELLNELKDLLHGVWLVKELTPRTMDCILSFGERLSATLMSFVLDNGVYFAANKLIRTNNNFGKARVNFPETNKLIQSKLAILPKKVIPVLGGFISSTDDGVITTLGRGGSDYSASIIAAALQASKLEIWTDVDGFMTADPSKVTNAYPIEQLSYAEAMELSHFGAKVVYTPTIQPAMEQNIPIVIKNTFNPTATGTLISNDRLDAQRKAIQGISSINKVSLLTLQGSGLVGVTGISMRLFSALAKTGVNIILISQASSEYSISFAISPSDVAQARAAIEQEFYVEMSIQQNITCKVEDELSIIAIVGENMMHTPGIAGNLFQSLGKNGINVKAIAQGSSELNISTVIYSADLIKALNVVHDSFLLSNFLQLNLFQIGIGNVGSKFLQQIQKQSELLFAEHKLKINVVGIAKSDSYLIQPQGIDLNQPLKQLLQEKGEKSGIEVFVKQMKDLNLPNSVFIDCTASSEISALYKTILSSYISVVTSNKIACSSEYAKYAELKQISKKHGVKFLYETNVAAGLPVIKTINDLLHSGDKIIQLEAVVSGTLNFIFNEISENVSLSHAIQLSMEKGYAEPDPRIDLSGTDVLRKLLILTREAGYHIEKQDVDIKNFLPAHCFETRDVNHFFEEVKKLDADFEAKRKVLAAQNHKWRYVARFANGKASIELLEVDALHPLFPLEGSDNIVVLYTERYSKQPMVIKGAGAGSDVTASGIFADIIRIANI